MILAFGATLGAAGLVTSIWYRILGAVFVLAGCVGWFGQVLPHESTYFCTVDPDRCGHPPRANVSTTSVVNPRHRAFLPGRDVSRSKRAIKGGIAGGIAMIIPAFLYG